MAVKTLLSSVAAGVRSALRTAGTPHRDRPASVSQSLPSGLIADRCERRPAPGMAWQQRAEI